MLGDNEVVSKEYNIALALPLVEVNKSEDEIEERSKKKRKLQRVATSEIIYQRAGLQDLKQCNCNHL